MKCVKVFREQKIDFVFEKIALTLCAYFTEYNINYMLLKLKRIERVLMSNMRLNKNINNKGSCNSDVVWYVL